MGRKRIQYIMSFVNLRNHSYFSIADSTLSPEDLVALSKQDGREAVALTDAGQMFGSLTLYQKAKKAGLKPILGVTCKVVTDITDPSAEPADLLLLATDLNSYRRLMKLVTLSWVEYQQKGIPLIPQSELVKDTKGLVALSGQLDGEISRHILAELKKRTDPETAADPASPAVRKPTLRALVNFYQKAFPGRFYLEVSRIGRPEEDQLVPALSKVASATGLPLVATQPVEFGKREDYFIHEVITADANSQQVDQIGRDSGFTREQYFRTEEEMREVFRDLPEAVDNAGKIAAKVNLDIPLNTNSLPAFQVPEGSTTEQHFKDKVLEGFKKQMQANYPDPAELTRVLPEYKERLRYEVQCILKMGFAGYFLVLTDALQWAKSRQIPIGPGRGSGAGSLVCYSLGITEVDPIPNNLLFERFLNPERVTMPDIDTDVDPDRMDELIEYLGQRYGEDKVAHVVAIGTMKSKAAVRNVGRVLGLPYPAVDEIANLIPNPVSATEKISVATALEIEPRLKQRYDEDSDIKRLLDVAMKVENHPRTVSQHPSAVVVAPATLTDFVPLLKNAKLATVLTQYDGHEIEHAGLIKFDFLSLASLRIIARAVQSVEKSTDKRIDMSAIPLDDAATYQALSAGDSLGVFQLESPQMTRLLRDLAPSSLAEITAIEALYRPGPMDLIPSYIKRKQGLEKITYDDPRLEPILKETYGIMVYQEQVMQAAQAIAGYTLGAADLLRRAMGKKIPEEMEAQRAIFVAGAVKNGLTEEHATHIFNVIEKFASYGFNKSHATAYATVSYRMAWLKTHYPAEFFAAAMSEEQANIGGLVKDAISHGVKVLPPDVNTSEGNFLSGRSDGQKPFIRFGLNRLKGVGAAAVQSIVSERVNHGPFVTFQDFVSRVLAGDSGLNKTSMTSLIKAGAFDGLETNRAALLATLPACITYASAVRKRRVQEAAQESLLPELFGTETKPKKKKSTRKVTPLVAPETVATEPFSTLDRMSGELDSLGFYLSGNPYGDYAKQLGGLHGATSLADIPSLDAEENPYQLVAGVVTALQKKRSLNGAPKLLVKIADDSGEYEVTVFSNSLEAVTPWLKVGEFAAFDVKVKAPRKEGDLTQLWCNRGFSFNDLKVALVREVNVLLDAESLEKLTSLVESRPLMNGSLALHISMQNKSNPNQVLRSDGKIDSRLPISEESLETIRQLVGDENFYLTFSQKPRRPERKYQRRYPTAPKAESLPAP